MVAFLLLLLLHTSLQYAVFSLMFLQASSEIVKSPFFESVRYLGLLSIIS